MKTRFSFIFTMLLVVGLFCVPKAGYSQRASSNNNNISGDFVGFLMPENTFTIQYEWKANSVQSWAVRAQYVVPGHNTTAFGVGGEMRFYFLDSRALAGFSVGPVADVFFFKNNDLGKSKVLFAVGGDIAHKWFFDHFTVEPSFGLRYGISSGEVFTSIAKYTTIYPVGSIYLGYAW
jgi:hypothetical protein